MRAIVRENNKEVLKCDTKTPLDVLCVEGY